MIHFLEEREEEQRQENQELKELIKELQETHNQKVKSQADLLSSIDRLTKQVADLTEDNKMLQQQIDELLLWFVFSKWGWKRKMFHTWLAATPDLSGRWEGTLHYVWNGQEGDRSTSVNILQSFNHVTVILSTSESDSRSVFASFDIDEKRAVYALYYTYVNEPNITIQDRSAIHYGTTRLRFEPDNLSVLKGEYWTSRDTKGTMELHRC